MRFATSFTSLTRQLMAIVPGMYLLTYLSARYLHSPSAHYYTILTLAATDYTIFLFLVYRLKCRIHNPVRSRDRETSVNCMNSDQQDERIIE